MSTTNTLGVPKLLPVTASFTLPLILLNSYMQVQCIQARIATKTSLGRDVSTSTKNTDKEPTAREPVSTSGATGEQIVSDPLLVATSIHDNFIQNAPFALILAGAVELNGGDRAKLAYTLAFFAFARVSHILGLSGGGMSWGKARALGFFGSSGVLLTLSGWSLYLVKGYWGF